MIKRPVLWIIPQLMVAVLVFLSGPVAAAQVESQRRVALIVGNSGYRGRLALNNPRNDAEAFAAALNKVTPKFDIVKITDMKAKDAGVILSRLEQNADKSSIALFYYAGHALQANDDNYLLPVDMPENPASSGRAWSPPAQCRSGQNEGRNPRQTRVSGRLQG